MKLAIRSAWLCASGVFLVTALPAFFREVAPVGLSVVPVDALQGMAIVETIVFSLIGSLMAGGIGYIIGDILGNPTASPEAAPESASPPSENASPPPEEAGEQPFLNDLEPISAIPLSEFPEMSGNPAEVEPEPLSEPSEKPSETA